MNATTALHSAVRQALLRPHVAVAATGLVAAGVALAAAIRGPNEPFPAEFELSSLLSANGGDGSTGFVPGFLPPEGGVIQALAGAADLNGDGIDDVILGGPHADPDDETSTGQTYVLFGRDAALGGFPAEFELAGLLPEFGGDGSQGFVVDGLGFNALAGRAISAGDINGDGVDAHFFGVPGPSGVPNLCPDE